MGCNSLHPAYASNPHPAVPSPTSLSPVIPCLLSSLYLLYCLFPARASRYSWQYLRSPETAHIKGHRSLEGARAESCFEHLHRVPTSRLSCMATKGLRIVLDGEGFLPLSAHYWHRVCISVRLLALLCLYSYKRLWCMWKHMGFNHWWKWSSGIYICRQLLYGRTECFDSIARDLWEVAWIIFTFFNVAFFDRKRPNLEIPSP